MTDVKVTGRQRTRLDHGPAIRVEHVRTPLHSAVIDIGETYITTKMFHFINQLTVFVLKFVFNVFVIVTIRVKSLEISLSVITQRSFNQPRVLYLPVPRHAACPQPHPAATR